MKNSKPTDNVFIQTPKESVYKESRLRSVLKGLTWRIVATSTIILIAYFTIGDISIAFQIGLVEFFIKLLLYYLHERAWQMVPRGGVRQIFNKHRLAQKGDGQKQLNKKAKVL